MNPTYKDCCWICDGWQEATISLSLENLDFENLSIHFELEEWRGVQLEKTDHRIYLFKKMLPKGMNKFFFTIDEKPIAFSNLPIINLKGPTILRV